MTAIITKHKVKIKCYTWSSAVHKSVLLSGMGACAPCCHIFWATHCSDHQPVISSRLQYLNKFLFHHLEVECVTQTSCMQRAHFQCVHPNDVGRHCTSLPRHRSMSGWSAQPNRLLVDDNALVTRCSVPVSPNRQSVTWLQNSHPWSKKTQGQKPWRMNRLWRKAATLEAFLVGIALASGHLEK